MAETPYQPIDCGFHDVLEAQAVRGTATPVDYRDASGAACTVHARVRDVFARGDEEFIVLEVEGETLQLRLDRLIAVAGIVRPGAEPAVG